MINKCVCNNKPPEKCVCSPVLNVGLISLEGAMRCSVMDAAAGNIENAILVSYTMSHYYSYILFM